MNKSIAYTVIIFCFFMTMVPLHAEELTEAQKERNDRIFGECIMDNYSQVINEDGFINFLETHGEEFVNCLKCKKHTDFISADGGENCDE